MKPTKLYILDLEWSESPYHQGTYSIFLPYHPNSKRWALSASRNPSGERLSWKMGDSEEDSKAVAIELLRKSYERGALEFDLITDNGPFQISIKDIVPKKTETSKSSSSLTVSPALLRLAKSQRMKRGLPPSRTKRYTDAQLRKLGFVPAQPRGSKSKPSTKL